jgi:hypothetical protein
MIPAPISTVGSPIVVKTRATAVRNGLCAGYSAS